VAIDSDPTMVGQVWRKATADRLDILSLVVDLTDPTPATGWRNGECSSFLTRATEHFDAVFFLAAWSALLAARNLIFRSTVLVDAAAVTLCVLGVAAVLFVAMRLARRLRTRVNGVQHLFLLALVVPIDWARMEVPVMTRGFWSQRLGAGGNAAWTVLMLAIGVCAAAVYVRHALQRGALVLLPLLTRRCSQQPHGRRRERRSSPSRPSWAGVTSPHSFGSRLGMRYSGTPIRQRTDSSGPAATPSAGSRRRQYSTGSARWDSTQGWQAQNSSCITVALFRDG
jgi:hypothetical protein